MTCVHSWLLHSAASHSRRSFTDFFSFSLSHCSSKDGPLHHQTQNHITAVDGEIDSSDSSAHDMLQEFGKHRHITEITKILTKKLNDTLKTPKFVITVRTRITWISTHVTLENSLHHSCQLEALAGDFTLVWLNVCYRVKLPFSWAHKVLAEMRVCSCSALFLLLSPWMWI